MEHLGGVKSWQSVGLVVKEVINDISDFERRRGAVRLLGNGKAKPLSTRKDVEVALKRESEALVSPNREE